MSRISRYFLLLSAVALTLLPSAAHAHGVDGVDRAFLEQSTGPQVLSFIRLGAKHMVTGYDHLLFLVGVIFFLHRLREVGLYVSLFAVGHSITLTGGVLAGTNVNPYLIDAIIGLSVAYKGLDNLGILKRVLRFQPDTRAAVLVFGLFHGLGLATKLQEFSLSLDGLVANIISFNVGVEIGQFVALAVILLGMRVWRATPSFDRYASAANVALVIAGVGLTTYQLNGYFAPAAPRHEPDVAAVAPEAGTAASNPAASNPAASNPAASNPAAAADAPLEFIFRSESVELTLAPEQGSEVKLVMRAGDQILYTWKAEGEVQFDFHGEAKGAPANEFTSYEKGTAASAEGQFEAPVEGTHGWYWHNGGTAPVTVRVEARGVYGKMSKL